jgi:hypothetical protein
MRIKSNSYYASKTSHLRLITGVNYYPALDGLTCGFMMIAMSTAKVFLISAINITVQKESITILLNQKVFWLDNFIFKYRISKFFKLNFDFIRNIFIISLVFIYH